MHSCVEMVVKCRVDGKELSCGSWSSETLHSSLLFLAPNVRTFNTIVHPLGLMAKAS